MSVSVDIPAVADEAYDRTLLKVRARAQALLDALNGAALCREPDDRTVALTELHTWLRGMAAVVNHALGGRPDDQEPQ